ncbi:MAG: hypothetical protein KZQ83_12915 [gamma proteobacterium symbiont of Taylorina sp.]|nr:hypothetical protein [gamma proteobacterium symbiont of Taylorina sp.]
MNATDLSQILQANGYQVKGSRSQCPGHGGKDLNLSFSNGHDGKLLLTCFSNHCTMEDITGALGLKVSDLFPANDSFNKAEYHRQKSQYQIDQECISSYRVIALFAGDVKKRKWLSQDDRELAKQAIKTINKYNFTHARHKQLMIERSLDTAYQQWAKLSTEQKYENNYI